MYKKVSTDMNFVEREKQVEKFWEDNQIFEKSMKVREGNPSYVFYDGPPTANGKPHIGHVETRVIKDMIPRYRTMKGYQVPRKAGWDTHGLPVELEVEKKLGLDGKDQIEKYGVEVTTVVIDDDVAVKDSLYTAGRRGVANTVLIEKLVGAAAERGDSLDACAELGRKLNNQGHSIGIALGACTVPAAGKPSFTLADNEMEFGVGIHGEPGIDRRPFSSLDQTVDEMFDTLLVNGSYHRTLRFWDYQQGSWQEEQQTKQPLQSGDRVIALVNNLGATPLSELYGVYNRLTTRCQQAGLTIERNLIGAYCTSLDMTGFSITLLKVDDETLALWDAPVHTPALNWGK